MLPDLAHDLECASAAFAVLIERAEGRGDRRTARNIRQEWKQYRLLALSSQKYSGADHDT